MRKLLAVTSFLAVLSGLGMLFGGLYGIYYTYRGVEREKITTPSDASIPGKPVLGPLTLKAQADIIRFHATSSAKGLSYAEMPRQIQKLDSAGNAVFDAEGKPVMVANEARNNWITATTLITALNLGIIAYSFSALTAFLGLSFIWAGIVSLALSRRMD